MSAGAAPNAIVVTAPPYVVIVHASGANEVVQGVSQIAISGGTRFAGNGYQPGEAFGQHFSFGVDSPTRVDYVAAGGDKKAITSDVKQVLLVGGTEGATKVSGDFIDDLSTEDILADVFTGGMYSASPYGAYRYATHKDGKASYGKLPAKADYSQSQGYQQAQANLTAAQMSQAAAQSKLLSGNRARSSVAPAGVIPVNVPSFSLPGGADIMGAWDDLTTENILANVFTGGIYGAVKYATDSPGGDSAPGTAPIPSSDYTKGRMYQQRQAALAQAQAAQTAAQAKQAAKPASAGVIPVNVPSFNLPTGSTDMSTDLTILGDTILGELGVKPTVSGDESAWSEIVGDDGGGSDYIFGCDVLGAPIAAMAGKAAPAVPKGAATSASKGASAAAKGAAMPAKIMTAKLTAGQKARKAAMAKRQSPHKAALVKTADIAKNAMVKGTYAQKRAAKYDPKQHTTIIPMKAVRVQGEIVLGTDRVLTAKQQQAVQRHANAIARQKTAVANAKRWGAAAVASAKKLDALRQQVTPAIAKLSLKGAKTLVHGDDQGYVSIIGAGTTKLRGDAHVVLGALGFEVLGTDAFGANPGDPNYDPTSDPASPSYNPSTAADATATTADAGASGYPMAAPDPNFPGMLVDGSPDPNWRPTRAQDLSQDDLMLPVDKKPDDGIPYDGRYGIPTGNGYGAGAGATHDGFGSAGGFFGGEGNPGMHNMYRWSQTPERWTWFHSGDMDDATEGTSQKVQNRSLAYTNPQTMQTWGPLIGSPTNQYVKNLQYAAADDTWFWQAPNAPLWATKEADDALQALAKQAQDALAKTWAANQATIAQEQAQQQEDQAKQDAANALAQSAADTQANIAQQQQAAQQAQLDIQDQAAQQQIAAADAKLELQQEAMMQKASDADLAYAIAHPEVAMQEAEQDAQQGGGDGGGNEGDGGGDDGDTTDRASEAEMLEAGDRGADMATAAELQSDVDEG